MKKNVSILPILLLLCALLSGCGEPTSPSNTPPAAAPDAAAQDSSAPPAPAPSQAALEETTEPEETEELEETLLITITVFSNGTDEQDGLDLIVYACDRDTLELRQLVRRKINATYPANTVDFERGIFYFADADEERLICSP